MPVLQPLLDLAEVCARQGMRDFILSPGSRCAPLTLALTRHPDLTTRTVSDERAAAFIGLGVAQASNRPVGLVCTSGTAAYNYAPAVAEAFFQRVPLLVLTADRPPEWIDQQDGQTIRQRGLYGAHVKASYELPVSYDHPDARWHVNRLVNEAVLLTRRHPAGPVHLNVPVREPFYPNTEETFDYRTVRVVSEHAPAPALAPAQVEAARAVLTRSERVLLVAGQGAPAEALRQALAQFSDRWQAPWVADIIANIPSGVQHQDAFLMRPNAALAPDLLITFGLSVISKNLKLFLRRHPAAQHWHIQPAGAVADTFQGLTDIWRADPTAFFTALAAGEDRPDSRFREAWTTTDAAAAHRMDCFWDEQLHGEFAATRAVLRALPAGSELHLANSMPVRYANFLGLAPAQRVRVRANRGTSGIDGCTSTAVGAALAQPDRIVTLLTGDLAFAYDRNGLWHNYLPANLRVVVLNNHGGGIFRLIDGPRRQPELAEYFETEQRLSAREMVAGTGLEYTHAHTVAEVRAALPAFFVPGAARLLEIETDSATNEHVYDAFRRLMQSE